MDSSISFFTFSKGKEFEDFMEEANVREDLMFFTELSTGLKTSFPY